MFSAALDLFAAKGFIRTSMDQIARQANVSKLTLYSHFTNKEDLFVSALEKRCFEDMPLGLIEEQFQDLGPEEALYKMGRYILDATLKERSLATYRVMLSEALAQPELMKIYIGTVLGGMTRRIVVILQHIAEQKEYEFPHLRKAAIYFFNMVNGPLHTLFLFDVKPLPTLDEQDAHLRYAIQLFLKAHKR